LIGFCEDIERMSAHIRTRVQVRQSETTEAMTLIVTLDERGQIAETYHIPDSSQEAAMKSTRGKA